jgi:hypothetical protein
MKYKNDKTTKAPKIFRVGIELYDAIKAEADARGLSPSAFANRLLRADLTAAAKLS